MSDPVLTIVVGVVIAITVVTIMFAVALGLVIFVSPHVYQVAKALSPF